jgi:DUF4097 and DUF4098 domain-containing protein YvlB
MKHCTKCGEKIQDAYFCHKCGHLTEKGAEEGAFYPKLSHRVWLGNHGNARYIADERKSFSGGVTMGKVSFEAENVNGSIRITTGDKPEYNIELTVEAGGYTKEEAEENLKELKVDLADEVTKGQKKLTLNIEHPHSQGRWYRIDIDVTLPAECEIDLDVGSKNGRITIEGVNGGILKMETKNGHLILDNVSAGFIKGKSSNGKIEGKIESKNTSLSTSNGRIYLDLPCKASGEYELRTSNGSIELETPKESMAGFDLNMRTSLGRINIDLPDLEYTSYRKTRKVAKTNGFDEKEVQIAIEAETSLGKIWLK